MRGPVTPPGGSADWSWVKSETIEALDALIDRQADSVNLKAVSAGKVEVPTKPWLAVQTVPTPRGGWDSQTFFVVDAETSGASKPARHQVHLKYEPKGRRVVVDLTPQLRRALGPATHVRVMYSDDTELNLLRMLRACLDDVTRGPLVLDLWSHKQMLPAPKIDGLNDEQAEAHQAMTTGGGWLVWGPPGTGKTTVIVKAVQDALANDRSVLIASHTHVAVDNVVKDLGSIVSEPAQVVRVGDAEKIDPAVVDHPWLMLDKAAAVLTKHAERLAEILKQREDNETHQARRRLDTVIDSLDQADLPEIEQAYAAREQAAQAVELRAEATAIEARMHRRGAEMVGLYQRINEAEPLVGLLTSLTDKRDTCARLRRPLAGQIQSADAEVQKTKAAERHWVAECVDADAELKTWSGKIPWRRAEITQRYAAAANALPSVRRTILSLESRVVDLRRQDALLAAEEAVAARRIAEVQETLDFVATLRKQVGVLESAQQRDATRKYEAEAAADQARVDAESVDDAEEIIARAEQNGIAQLIKERDLLNEFVAQLDEQLKDLDQQKRKLDDEYANTRRALLESAPVIGCTLTALTTKPELTNRRFDTVIIDEAASASIPHLIHAGSKADRCLAYVGDFLQNSPITEVDDAKTDRQRELLPWQREDIFGLCGIRDRMTAQKHARCVALRTQFRYPHVIADIVNDFCYDGLLETDWNKPIDGPIVTFIDTSRHPERGLRRDGKSWTHPLGLRLMDVIYQHRGVAGSIGLVCPYNAHAARAAARVRDNEFDMPCGTSHKFQGRQFDTVIVDLMQDDQPRWVAWADLHGSEREVSAAKLLNVAITRAKQRLFLVGDWNFVRSHRTPGMQAIARLRSRPEFELISAEHVCRPTPHEPTN